MEVQTGTDLLSVALLPALAAALFPVLQHDTCLQVHKTFHFHEACGFFYLGTCFL